LTGLSTEKGVSAKPLAGHLAADWKRMAFVFETAQPIATAY
jgi:hypothetical protein